MKPKLSILLPAYNEGRRIFSCVRALDRYFKRRRAGFEIVVVDDGSSDRTGAEARRAARGIRNVRVIGSRPNRGKGYALRRGVAAARGARILFLDVDLSTKPDQWPRLEARLDAGADIAIGSRKMAGANLLRRQPWWRERLGKVFTFLVRLLLVDVSDVTCGFKAFRATVAKRLFARQVLDDWSFDAEVLFLARRAGLRVDEVPVVWRDDPDSKVRLASAAIDSLKGLLKIRLNHAIGRYGDLRAIK